MAAVAAPSLAMDAATPAAPAVAILAAVAAPVAAVDQKAAEFSSDAPLAPTLADAASIPADAIATTDPMPATLREAVDNNLSSDTADAEQKCLATAVYFEAKGEPLEGQLAVAETLINRTHSSRFPGSLCGVVRQRGQFSFVHGNALPAIHEGGHAWQEAVAVATVATHKLWKPVAATALYFHARNVSPGWGLTRVASLGKQIFYR